MIRRKGQYHSNTSFLDLLFNTLVGFVMLFIIAFLLISPIKKKKEIEQKAEYVITVSWPNDHSDDVDTWLEDPMEKLMSFRTKEIGLMHLDRDDLGTTNDRIIVDGKVIFIKTNRETITIRGIIPGDYFVTVHAYSKKAVSVPYTVTVMKVNPFRQIYSLTGEFLVNREIQRLPAFTVDANGRVRSVFQHFKDIVPSRSGAGTQ